MERALFLSAGAALTQARRMSIKGGVSEISAMRFCAAFPVRKRGQIVGYEAWYPPTPNTAHHDNLFRSPVMEKDM